MWDTVSVSTQDVMEPIIKACSKMTQWIVGTSEGPTLLCQRHYQHLYRKVCAFCADCGTIKSKYSTTFSRPSLTHLPCGKRKSLTVCACTKYSMISWGIIHHCQWTINPLLYTTIRESADFLPSTICKSDDEEAMTAFGFLLAGIIHTFIYCSKTL